MISKTLIPSIASRDRWRKYFRSGVFRALGYCRKILSLYDRICVDSSSPLIKKMVMGVIGRDTVGHWRDIQTFYRKFFGITCKKCEEAVKRVAIGIPLDKVLDNVSVQTVHKWKLVGDVKTLTITLSSVVNKVVKEDDVVQEDVDSMIKRLSSNPLEVLRLVKGFYSTSISLLPLYNECTFFLYITRSVHRDLIDKFFPNIDMAMLSSYGIEFNTIRLCKDDKFSILVPSTNSVNQYMIIYTETLYQILKQSLKLGLTTFFEILDEEQVFISTMANEAKKIEKEMNSKVSSTVVNTIRKNSLTRKTKFNYTYSTTNVVFYRDKDEAIVGSGTLRCEDLFEGLSPYFITGLAHFSDIHEKEGGVVKARLHLYCYLT